MTIAAAVMPVDVMTLSVCSSENTVLRSVRSAMADQPHLLHAVRQEAAEPGHRTLQRGGDSLAAILDHPNLVLSCHVRS